MTIFIGLFILLLLVGAKWSLQQNCEYLARECTNTVKGFFLLLVFVRHFLQYDLSFSTGFVDRWGITVNNLSGQLIVTMFLFYSGYGVMESYQKKGMGYISTFPRKRLLSTLVHFDIAVIIYMICFGYVGKEGFSVKKLVLSMLGWDTYGNSNWYIFQRLPMVLLKNIP